MAVRWSSENVVAEFRDLQANAMAVDCTGQFTVLAGRKCIAVVGLEQPCSVLKKSLRQSKWEVGTAEWNPTQENSRMFALTSNQRAELMVCTDAGEIVQKHVLRAHTRVITDLNWSPFDPSTIATCSVDTFVHVWDIRDSRRPTNSLSAVAGAGQVKWNKCKNNLLATSHDGDVRLWDIRKSTVPLQYIAAHLSKIHGLDWNPLLGQEYHIVTSSQDCTVKFWDVTNPCRPHSILSSNSPVWRARYTPFGEGLITAVVPQLRRGENCLLLWSSSNLLSPVHTFVGHTDVVLEFQWRELREETKDYQLVTWSKDQSLRIWSIDSHLQRLCGHDANMLDDLDQDSALDSLEYGPIRGGLQEPSVSDLLTGDGSASYRVVDPRETSSSSSAAAAVVPGEEVERSLGTSTEAERVGDGQKSVAVVGEGPIEPSSPVQPKTLQQEFLLLNRSIPNIRVEEMDAAARTCMVAAVSGKVKVRLMLTFPLSYPVNSPPTIQFCRGTSVSNNVKNELTRILQSTCQQHVKKNLSCLEPCLRQLTVTLESYNQFEKDIMNENSLFGMDSSAAYLPPPKMYGSYQDANVPFPRTCGASFCGAGQLVCFSRPAHMKDLTGGAEITPRSLSALSAFAGTGRADMQPISRAGRTTPPSYLIYPSLAQSPTGDSSVSVSSYYYLDRRMRARNKAGDPSSKSRKIGIVIIYDVSGLFLICRRLARNYVFQDSDIPSMCRKNMAAAAEVGRKDLVQVWSIVALSANANQLPQADPLFGPPWACHPFGRKLLQSIINHYLSLGDVQTVAMLSCIFSPQPVDGSSSASSRKQSPCSDSLAYPTQGGSPYHTIHPGETGMDGYSLGALLKSNRSNSWSDCLDDHDSRHFPLIQDPLDLDREKHDNNTRMLDPERALEYDEFKRAYAEILYFWNLLDARATVLKQVSTAPEPHKGIEFVTECCFCHNETRGVQCGNCRRYSFQCVICHVTVKGAFNFCLACGHGGHTVHLTEWFRCQSVCPSGCGCQCLSENIWAES